MSAQALLHNGSYTFTCFFWILSAIKKKFGRLLMCCMKKFPACYWLNVGGWKLVPGPSMILLKWKYSETQPFLMVDICQF